MDQGAEFQVRFALSGESGSLDLSSFTGSSKMRRHAESANSVSINVILEPGGVVEMSLSSANTAEVEAGRYMYDVEITSSDNQTFRVLEGIMTVTPNITR